MESLIAMETEIIPEGCIKVEYGEEDSVQAEFNVLVDSIKTEQDDNEEKSISEILIKNEPLDEDEDATNTFMSIDDEVNRYCSVLVENKNNIFLPLDSASEAEMKVRPDKPFITLCVICPICKGFCSSSVELQDHLIRHEKEDIKEKLKQASLQNQKPRISLLKSNQTQASAQQQNQTQNQTQVQLGNQQNQIQTPQLQNQIQKQTQLQTQNQQNQIQKQTQLQIRNQINLIQKQPQIQKQSQLQINNQQTQQKSQQVHHQTMLQNKKILRQQELLKSKTYLKHKQLVKNQHLAKNQQMLQQQRQDPQIHQRLQEQPQLQNHQNQSQLVPVQATQINRAQFLQLQQQQQQQNLDNRLQPNVIVINIPEEQSGSIAGVPANKKRTVFGVYCKVCLKMFPSDGEFQEHLKDCASETEFQCDVCFKIFKKKSSLRTHSVTHVADLYMKRLP